ncbi:MAG: glycosyltransferase family 2 protein, partial [Dyadobacter sp.]
MAYLNLKHTILRWHNFVVRKLAGKREKERYLKMKQINLASLKRIDKRSIPNDKSELRLFAIMRNESLRLPHFINYYKDKGVDRFFIVDNNSTDVSLSILESRSDAHLFSTSESYKDHWFWMEYLLETFGREHWCLVVDIDELFYYHHAEQLSIKDLCMF